MMNDALGFQDFLDSYVEAYIALKQFQKKEETETKEKEKIIL